VPGKEAGRFLKGKKSLPRRAALEVRISWRRVVLTSPGGGNPFQEPARARQKGGEKCQEAGREAQKEERGEKLLST